MCPPPFQLFLNPDSQKGGSECVEGFTVSLWRAFNSSGCDEPFVLPLTLSITSGGPRSYSRPPSLPRLPPVERRSQRVPHVDARGRKSCICCPSFTLPSIIRNEGRLALDISEVRWGSVRLYFLTWRDRRCGERRRDVEM